jgi:hypothetical protein
MVVIINIIKIIIVIGIVITSNMKIAIGIIEVAMKIVVTILQNSNVWPWRL